MRDIFKFIGIEGMCGDRDMMFFAVGIGETQINELDFVVGDQFRDVFGGCHSLRSWSKGSDQCVASPGPAAREKTACPRLAETMPF